MNKEQWLFFSPVIIVAVVGLLVLSQFPESPSGEVSIGRVMPKPDTPGIKPGDKVGVGVSPGGPVGEKVVDKNPPIKVGVGDEIGAGVKPGREIIPEKVEVPKGKGKFKVPPALKQEGDKPKEGIPGEGDGGGRGGPFVDERKKELVCVCSGVISAGFIKNVIEPTGSIPNDRTSERKKDSDARSKFYKETIKIGVDNIEDNAVDRKVNWFPERDYFLITHSRETISDTENNRQVRKYTVTVGKDPLSFSPKKQPNPCTQESCTKRCNENGAKQGDIYVYDSINAEALEEWKNIAVPTIGEPGKRYDQVDPNPTPVKHVHGIKGRCTPPESIGK